VALRTIEAGEIILKENPLIFGPDGTTPVCLGCYEILTQASAKCKSCGFPVCSKACANSEMHKTMECEVLRKSGLFKMVPIDVFVKFPYKFYEMIWLLRIFLLQEKDPDRWTLIWNLKSPKTENQIQHFLTSSVAILLDKIGLLEEDIPTFTKIMGIVNVNQFECGLIKQKLRNHPTPVDTPVAQASVLFGLASMLMHDCLANTIHAISSAKEGFVITFKAIRTIKEGEQITLCFVDLLRPILERKDKIASKCFVVSIFCISSRQHVGF
jgi:hypothetical protein